MAQKGPSFSEWFAARQEAAPAGTMSAGAAAPSAPSAGVSLASLFSSAATAPALAAAPDAEKSGGAASAPAGSAVAASLTSIAALMLPSVVRAGQSVGLGGIAPGVPAPAEEWNCGMNSAQRFQAFGILLVTSLLLYVSAIFVFLPMVIFMPSKCVACVGGLARACVA